MSQVIIIGGGLAGLVSAIQLADAGLDVLVIEKRKYPFHRVCGEYISNEVLPFLKKIGADPAPCSPSYINKLLVSSPSGKSVRLSLEMGGFGISRYSFDHYLYWVAITKKVAFLQSTTVTNVVFRENKFIVTISTGEQIEAPIVIGSYGKRSNLDRILSRAFFTKNSPYIGVKYHIKTDFPNDTIALHNFKDGYCGISKIEKDTYSLCYLTTRQNLKNSESLLDMEEKVLYKNPYLKEIFTNSDFLFKKPEIINEISFEPKPLIENHILMCGDSAGMITPLCGNGMSMAIHSSKILCELIIKHLPSFNRHQLEQEYLSEWKKAFASRLYYGRKIQSFFGNEHLSNFLIQTVKLHDSIGKYLIKKTHGEVIEC